MQTVVKLYTRLLLRAEDDDDETLLKEACQMLLDRLPMFVQSADLEVQERVSSLSLLVGFRFLRGKTFIYLNLVTILPQKLRLLC